MMSLNVLVASVLLFGFSLTLQAQQVCFLNLRKDKHSSPQENAVAPQINTPQNIAVVDPKVDPKIDLSNTSEMVVHDANKIDSLVTLFYNHSKDVNADFIDPLTEEDSNNNPIDLAALGVNQRLKQTESIIPLTYNPIVHSFIKLYASQRSKHSQRMLGLGTYYFPIFEEVLDRHGMPLELKYLSVIESALNPRAVSHAGAAGLWQFMYATGKRMGLNIDNFVDERRDPWLASDAAARYLKELYGIYHDWHLAIAAYNCGPGNVNKAIRRSGGKLTYWEIYDYLPRETRGYVPAFIAACYVLSDASYLSLKPISMSRPLASDTVIVKEPIHFAQLQSVLNCSIDQLRDLNPLYRNDVIPADSLHGYVLRLPHGLVANFIDKEQEVYAYQKNIYFPGKGDANLTNALAVNSYDAGILSKPAAELNEPNKKKVYYSVKRGESLGYVAELFNTSVSNLKKWNKLSKNSVLVNQKLAVYVSTNEASWYQKVNYMSGAEKQKLASAGSISEFMQQKKLVALAPSKSKIGSQAKEVYYIVKVGDTLWSIAQKFPGISNTEIMQLNNLKNAQLLYPGQKLLIKQPKNNL